MPANDNDPPVLLACESDLRAYAGATLFSRGGTAVTAPASWPRFEDVIQALTGYTSQTGADLGADATAAWTGAPTVITAGVTDSDEFFLHSSAVAFSVTPTGTGWGLPAGATASSPTGGGTSYGAGHVVRGTADWTRGAFVFGSAGNSLTITPSGGGAAFVAPSYTGTVSALPLLLRKAAIGDVDATRVADCVEARDNAALGVTSLRWGLNAENRIFSTRPNGVAARPSFGNTAFRDAMGFTGLETEVASGNLRTLTATNEPLWSALAFGLTRCHPWIEERGDYTDLRNGSIAGQELEVVSGWEVEAYFEGPAMVDADQTRHLWDRFLPLARRARGLNIYRQWGDTRRATPRRSVTASTLAYSLLHTSELDGTRGRLRCVRDATDEARRRPAYQGQPEVVGSMSFILRNRVD